MDAGKSGRRLEEDAVNQPCSEITAVVRRQGHGVGYIRGDSSRYGHGQVLVVHLMHAALVVYKRSICNSG